MKDLKVFVSACFILVWSFSNVIAEEPIRASRELQVNELQLLGTHNSYHLAPDKVAMELIRSVVPSEAKAIDVSQRVISDQLSQLGVRHLELDLYLDPKGGLFSKPAAYSMALDQKIEVPEFDEKKRMFEPGIKILHSPDFDYRTTVYTLTDALIEIKEWSDANQTHVPIFVLLELKSDSFSPLTRPVVWDERGFEELEKTILKIWPRDRILTPDDVRGEKETLREAISGIGWPAIEKVRGKIGFLLDNEGKVRDDYLSKSEILAGRLLFVSVDRRHPAAAWMKRNDPVGSFDEIRSLVASGFMVRTRADAGTIEARMNDETRMRKAISSGAQLISTDFLEADQRFSSYRVQLDRPPE
jgi:hypothetical protein